MRFLFGLIAATALSAAAHAESRVALLIGNEDYPADVSRLNNPHEDVDALAAALIAAGFPREAVTVVKDADRDATFDAVAAFKGALSRGGADAVGFFYYSGHGGSFERQGFRENYLIPSRANITLASDLPRSGVSLTFIVDELAATGAKAVFIVSDACRNSLPFSRGGGDADKGFAVEPARPGLFIAHATAEGSTAPDDGVFARALAAQLPQPGLYAERAFTLAFRDVARSRPTYRLPTVASDLREDFCFVSCPGEPIVDRDDDPAAVLAEARTLLREMGYETDPGGFITTETLAAFAANAGLGRAPELDGAFVDTLRYFQAQGHRAPGAAASTADAEDEARRRDQERLAALAEQGLAPPITDTSPSGARAPGESFRDCAACPEMVVIPAGEFLMGTPSGEPGHTDDESPQRTVRIASFAAGRFEVTFDQWTACVDAGGCGGHRPSDQGLGRGSRPVVNVSWQDAQAYIAWLNAQVAGAPYRLLTEAEWEYAARAGTTGRYSNDGGPAELCAIANTSDQSRGGAIPCNDGYGDATAPAGSFAPNAFGLYDMHGNVFEFVEDCYRDSYAGAPTDGSAVVAASCEEHVRRGGSWQNGPNFHRSGNRSYGFPGYRQWLDGFRVARSL